MTEMELENQRIREQLNEANMQVLKLERENDAFVKLLRDAHSMLNTVALCATHECEDCREHAILHRDAIKSVLASIDSHKHVEKCG